MVTWQPRPTTGSPAGGLIYARSRPQCVLESPFEPQEFAVCPAAHHLGGADRRRVRQLAFRGSGMTTFAQFVRCHTALRAVHPYDLVRSIMLADCATKPSLT